MQRIFISSIFFLYFILIINNRYLNSDFINTSLNKSIFHNGKQLTTFYKYYPEINTKVNDANLFLLDKHLFSINIINNKHSIDPFSMYDDVVCNAYFDCLTDIKRFYNNSRNFFIIARFKDDKIYINNLLSIELSEFQNYHNYEVIGDYIVIQKK